MDNVSWLPSPHPAMSDSTLHPSVQLLRMITAPWISQAIYVAAKLGVADLLSEGPQTVEHIAKKTVTNPEALYRVLRGLASVGIFTEAKPRSFALTPLADALRSGVPGSMCGFAILNGEERYRTFGEVLTSVQTGLPVFEKAMGATSEEYFHEHPVEDAIRIEASTTFSHQLDGFVAHTYDFSSIKHLVAIGGIRGTLTTMILHRYPDMRASILTSPGNAEAAQERLVAEGVANRCNIVPGDIFTTLPPQGDAYLIPNTLHAWSDDKAARLLQNVRRAITPEGRVLSVEMVLPEGDEPHFGKVFDLFLLVMRGGRERTEAEFRQLFNTAGFTIEQIVSTQGPVSVIEARPELREKRRS